MNITVVSNKTVNISGQNSMFDPVPIDEILERFAEVIRNDTEEEEGIWRENITTASINTTLNLTDNLDFDEAEVEKVEEPLPPIFALKLT